ncbi:type IVa pilus pseudopilin TppD [Aeromonas sp. MR16]|uniref:type IVa pilus pseudopilin TppD n=1 Tax=Aeromonas sp. MR16 TaxID=2923420 RepID=UPI001F4A6AFD|nr:type IVa pilus pseudopilin TppD [Aeromonas sp. MR16]MCH7371459.1 type IVa pilus pseudopilin TppD [Aeromonas sp. MR16]
MNNQRGVALIVALIILVPLTLIAVVVMQSSGQDLKMAGSAASFRQAEHRLEGIIEAALQRNDISTRIANISSDTGTSAASGTTGVTLISRTETVCKRKVEASSNNVIPKCKYVELQTNLNYGKYASQLNWVAGVEQPLLTK